ncbi:SMI1/KNR4 family protein [Xanthomonas sp. 3075]|uniref:SMI1/KNR4 family protein n=1 Tax=Xanthomonas sp. 3075 TaxID=3035315 RepID=UPI001621863F|nr:SMI1/KNR4 family protein [Xanthomonas sp. 3075]MBB4133306.1 hypothetical protein [Xanthomonas sp. 3075]
MDIDLATVHPGLVDAWNFTRENYPKKVACDLEPLKKIEKDCDAAFPADYLAFMGKYGGLQMRFDDPRRLLVEYSIAGNLTREACHLASIMSSKAVLEWYLRLSRPDEHYENIGARIPAKTVPIGVTEAGGEYYLIDLSDRSHGTIWRMAPENHGTWCSEGNAFLGLAAGSFTKLLTKLVTEDDLAAGKMRER